MAPTLASRGSIRGPQGPQGATGAQGVQGSQGPKGDTGAAGTTTIRGASDYDQAAASPVDGNGLGWWSGANGGAGGWQPQGFVTQFQRAPIGGTSASTLVTQTYSLDATGAIFRRFTLTGNPTLSVPTGGADGQKLTLWLLASGADRTFTFASGYEVSPQVPSRVITIANGTWERFDLECRNGTWRIVGTDQLLFSAADIGGLTQAGADARYPRGIVARNRRTTNAAQTTATGSPMLAPGPNPLSRVAGPVVAGRLYRVHAPVIMIGPNNAATSVFTLFVFVITMTTNGSTPGTGSTVLAQNHLAIPAGLALGTPVLGSVSTLYAPTTDHTLSLQLQMTRNTGSQLFTVYAGQPGLPLDLVIEDLGLDPGSSGNSAPT